MNLIDYDFAQRLFDMVDDLPEGPYAYSKGTKDDEPLLYYMASAFYIKDCDHSLPLDEILEKFVDPVLQRFARVIGSLGEFVVACPPRAGVDCPHLEPGQMDAVKPSTAVPVMIKMMYDAQWACTKVILSIKVGGARCERSTSA